MGKFNVGDIVKSAKKDPPVYGVIIHSYFGWYKVLWFDEEIEKENYNHEYPAYYLAKVSQ